VIERYVLHRLPEAAGEELDEHLLVCHHCMDRVAAESIDLPAMKIVLGRANVRKTWWERFEDRFSFPGMRPVWAAVSAALVLLAVAVPLAYRNSSEAPVAVELRAFRSDSSGRIVVPSARVLSLRLSAEGLPDGPGWTAHIVDSVGNEVQTATLEIEGAVASFHVNKGLSRGDYWVRLMPPQEPDHPLREYQLSVR
jgi:hypothetical protein